MAFQGNFTEEFSTRVLKKLKKPKKEIAYDIGVPYKSKLYQSTKDPRIFDFFLRPAGFVAIEDSNGKGRKLMKDAAKALKALWEFMDYEQDKNEKK